MKNFKEIDLFLLDMDGTVYFEDKLIDGAQDFIFKLIEQRKKYIFISNNSSINKNNYLNKMNNLGIPCLDENVFSSSTGMGLFLKEKRGEKKVYLVGTKALEEELKLYNVEITDQNPDIVVVGYDRELNYQKLEKACYFLDLGCEFLATNPDLVYPLKNERYIPDCGSICHMLTVATKKEPLYIGKPNRYMVDIIAKEYEIDYDKMAIIGDRLYTDVAMGKNAGITSICVLSGETKEDMINSSNIKPDYIFSSIKELINLI